MKRNTFTAIIASALVLVLALTGCAQAEPQAKTTTRTVRVIGSAVKANATRAVGDKYVIDSVDSVVVNGVDIKDRLVPADPASITGEKQNNVTFVADVAVPENVEFSAEGKPGYVFDEWEVMEIEEDEEADQAAAAVDPKLLDEIEDWLEDNGLEHEETLINVPANYLTYLVADYDNGFYVTLDAPKAEEPAAEGAETAENDGTKAHPYTVDEIAAMNYGDDELTLVISGSDEAEFGKLMEAIGRMEKLEELKLKAEGAKLSALPALAGLEEISLTGFTFDTEIEIDNEKGEYKFVDCTFLKSLTVTAAKEIELRGGSYAGITVTAAEEVGIKGGRHGDITVIRAEEVEIEDAEAGIIDLSAMTAGEVELENVTYTELRRPAEGVEFEEEKAGAEKA